MKSDVTNRYETEELEFAPSFFLSAHQIIATTFEELPGKI
jgi:hypothetical protein